MGNFKKSSFSGADKESAVIVVFTHVTLWLVIVMHMQVACPQRLKGHQNTNESCEALGKCTAELHCKQ